MIIEEFLALVVDAALITGKERLQRVAFLHVLINHLNIGFSFSLVFTALIALVSWAGELEPEPEPGVFGSLEPEPLEKKQGAGAA